MGCASELGSDEPSLGPQLTTMGSPESFQWSQRKNGEIVITHHDKMAATLRGRKAEEFLENIAGGDGQELMARLTGNYKRGNERVARNHERNK